MIKTTVYKPVVESVEAVKWDAMLGWEFALELAEWCGGDAVQDKNPMNTEKTYYWQIWHESFTAVPGDYIVKYPDGNFMVANSKLFERDYEVVS